MGVASWGAMVLGWCGGEGSSSSIRLGLVHIKGLKPDQ